jgi:hypothetical protein
MACDNRRPSEHRTTLFRYTTEELLSITAQYAINKEATKPLPISGDREAVPCSNKAAPSNVVIQDIKGGKKRRKQRLSGLRSRLTMTTTRKRAALTWSVWLMQCVVASARRHR